MTSEPDLGVDIGALSARIRFQPDEAGIWLEGQRMMLLHLAAFASFRKELIEHVGLDAARGMLMRMGYASGSADAAIALRAKREPDVLTQFMAGPRLHAIEGMVVVEPVAHEFDPSTGHHAGEWIWRNSAEVEAHLAEHGLSAEPVCWSAIGYASAYTSTFMGRPILYREVECRGMGHAHCRIVGKPAELWDADVRDDLHQGLPLAAIEDDWRDAGAAPLGTTWDEAAMVGASAAFGSMKHLVSKVAPTEAAVLLVGEVGVGKKSLARALHRLSKRSRQPFITMNCASFAGDALDAELFGLDRSGAGPSRPGRIEKAHNGTLLLEDVHCLDLRAQAKLLRVLQTGEVDRSGQPRSVRVRIIATCSPRIMSAVRGGAFREDLYYKLNAFPINIAPLRERRSDIPVLIRHFGSLFAIKHGKSIRGIAQSAISFVLTYDFPGNVAELESMIERAVILASADGTLDLAHLSSTIDQRGPRFFRVTPRGALADKDAADEAERKHPAPQFDKLLDGAFRLEQFERDIIARAVERASGNLSKAARELGMTRPQLAYRYRKLQGEPDLEDGEV